MTLTANDGRFNNEKIKNGKSNKSACGEKIKSNKHSKSACNERTNEKRIELVRNRPDRHSRC